MRREIIFGLVLMLALSSITIISENVSAELKKEDMTWSIGDKWEYRYTTVDPNMTMSLVMNIEISGESTIEIDGVNYDVYVGEISGEVETITTPPSDDYSFSLVDGSTIDGTMYVAKESAETTKTVQNIIYGIREEMTGLFLNSSSTVTTITRVISGGRPDTIDIDDNWSSAIKTITTTNATISGSFWDAYSGEPNYTNTTTSTVTNTVTSNYRCTGRNNITTPAGEFDGAYEIEQTTVGGTGSVIQYLSTTAKDEVKDTTYDAAGDTLSLIELISYDVTPATASPSTQTKTPGFELVIVICSIAMILLWKRKRAN